jgi:hypothetical protein
VVDDDGGRPRTVHCAGDGYLNVYYRGNSLVRLTADAAGKLAGEVNYKYLLRPSLKDFLWKMTYDGEIAHKAAAHAPVTDFFHDLNDLVGMKKASGLYVGVEKEGVAKIAANQNNVIDLEVAFSSGTDGNGSTQLPRLDLVALHSHAGELGEVLVFY